MWEEEKKEWKGPWEEEEEEKEEDTRDRGQLRFLKKWKIQDTIMKMQNMTA